MANRTFYDTQSTNPELKMIAGRIQLQGGSNPTISAGTGFTVIRLGASDYSITFDEVYPAVLSVSITPTGTFHLNRSTTGGIVASSGLGASGFRFEVNDISAFPFVQFAGDLTGESVDFVAFVRNTSVTR